MYYVQFWNGKHIISLWCETLLNLSGALEIAGYCPDQEHYIKIKFCPSVIKSNFNDCEVFV